MPLKYDSIYFLCIIDYSLGVLLVGRVDDKVVATFNMKDEKTRRSFVDELDEYIREVSLLY